MSSVPREKEKPSERLARERLEPILGIRLERVKEDDRPSPDYWCIIHDGRAGFEVKQIASPDWLRLRAGFGQLETERATSDLSKHWLIALPAELAAGRLEPAPRFPEDNEAQIAHLADFGLTVVRKAERIAKFEHHRQEKPTEFGLKGIIDDLIPDLQILEAHGITTTRGPMPSDPGGAQAQQRIAGRTRNAICLASSADPAAGVPSGVFLSMSYGYVRTSRADSIADRIQAWFDTESRSRRNLIQSLEREEYDQGHAVLVFDDLEPEFRPAQDADTFLPTLPLSLPVPVDVVWALLGDCTLRYSTSEGWSEHRSRSADVTTDDVPRPLPPKGPAV